MRAWDRLEGEPERWYARFIDFFVPQGPDRTMEEAYRQWRKSASKPDKKSRPPVGWSDAARIWRWRDRAADWDAAQRQQALDETEKERTEMFKRHIKTSLGLQNAALAKLKKILGDPEKGIPGEWESMTPDQVLRFLEKGIALERQARGEPEQIVKHSGMVFTGPVSTSELADMSDEELDEHIERLGRVASRLSEASTRSGVAGEGTPSDEDTAEPDL